MRDELIMHDMGDIYQRINIYIKLYSAIYIYIYIYIKLLNTNFISYEKKYIY